MSLNSPLPQDQWRIEVSVRWVDGWRSRMLSVDEVKAYNQDPDGYVAKAIGVSVADYTDWIENHGMPLCGSKTKAGKLCRIPTGCIHMPIEQWLEQHRAHYCKTHGG